MADEQQFSTAERPPVPGTEAPAAPETPASENAPETPESEAPAESAEAESEAESEDESDEGEQAAE